MSDYLSYILGIVFVGLCIYAFIKVLATPVKWIFKLLINAGTGFLLLFAANIIGGFFDFSIDVTVLNCLITGFLGIPGVVLMVLAKFFL